MSQYLQLLWRGIAQNAPACRVRLPCEQVHAWNLTQPEALTLPETAQVWQVRRQQRVERAIQQVAHFYSCGEIFSKLQWESSHHVAVCACCSVRFRGEATDKSSEILVRDNIGRQHLRDELRFSDINQEPATRNVQIDV